MQIIPKKRRLENKTSYKKRRRLLESGKPRIVVRKSNKYLVIQYVESKVAQDSVKIIVSTKDLIKQGWPKDKVGSLKSLGACYLAGLLFASKVEDKKKEAILDTGLIRNTKGSRVYTVLKGIVDGGVNVPHGKDIFPDESRINTEKTKDFFDKIKSSIGGSK